MAIKTIIFDLGNTVVNFDHRPAVKRILPFTGKSFDEILEMFFDSDLTERFETGKISPRQFYSEVKNLLSLKLEYDKFVAIWNEIFTPSPEVEEIVKKLKNKYRLLLLSNVNILHMDYIKDNFPIVKEFEDIVTSYEVGCRKPDARIYEAAMGKAHCLKNELVYTDDREDLIKASSALGIQSVVFKDARQLREDFARLGISLNGA